MKPFQDKSKNKLLLAVFQEDVYTKQLSEIIKLFKELKTNVCYVCLNRPYNGIINDLKRNNLDISRFFFIDILSSHNAKPKPVKNCVFIEEPIKIEKIQSAITDVINKKKCKTIIVDTVSTMLDFESIFSITQFVHNLVIKEEDINKIFIVLKENELTIEYPGVLTKDLSMFADKVIEFKK